MRETATERNTMTFFPLPLYLFDNSTVCSGWIRGAFMVDVFRSESMPP